MVAEATGAYVVPQRILVVDELVSEVDTYLMTINLLILTFLNPETRLLTSKNDIGETPSGQAKIDSRALWHRAMLIYLSPNSTRKPDHFIRAVDSRPSA